MEPNTLTYFHGRPGPGTYISVPEGHTPANLLLYDLRLKAKLSLRELAKLSGISKSQISYLENDMGKSMTIEQLVKFAKVFNIEPTELFQRYLQVSSKDTDNTTKQNTTIP